MLQAQPVADELGVVAQAAMASAVQPSVAQETADLPEAASARKRAAMACCAVAVTAALVAGGVASGCSHEMSAEQAAQEFDAVVALVEESNTVITPMSELMSAELTDETVNRINEVLAGIEDAQASLKKAKSNYDKKKDALAQHVDAVTLQSLEGTIAARQDMMTYGSIILNAGTQTYAMQGNVKGAWGKVTKAQKLLVRSARNAKKGTTEKVQRALEQDQQALNLCNEARTMFEEVAAAAPAVDLSAVLDYIDAQRAAAESAIAADEALLSNDKQTAKAKTAEYGKYAKEAASLAKKLPTSADEVVKSIYYSLGTDVASVQDAETYYASAAGRAAADDVIVGNYITSRGSQ